MKNKFYLRTKPETFFRFESEPLQVELDPILWKELTRDDEGFNN